MKLDTIHHVALICSDYQASRHFYVDLLGFEIIRENYFDVNPVLETGTASCMIPYHELKRCILNRLYPDKKQERPVYLGVESLGWMWF